MDSHNQMRTDMPLPELTRRNGSLFSVGCRPTEEAVRDSEALLNAVMTAFDGFIYTCSPDYRVQFHNEAMRQRIGHNAVGEFCYKALHERDSVCPWCVNDRVFAGETVRSEAQSPKDNRWFDITSSPVWNGGSVISKLGMFVDITDRKQAEQALLESESRVRERSAELENRQVLLDVEIGEHRRTVQFLRESDARYRVLFESSMDAIFMSEGEGVIFSANSAACTLFGMTEEELCLAGRAGVIDPDDWRVSKAVKERADSGRVRSELRFKRKDGTTFLGEVSSVILDEAKAFSFVIVRDISDRKQAEEKIISLNVSLDQRVKERTAELESAIHEQESFSYSVSHDLRAPLRHINSFSAMLIEDFGDGLPIEAHSYLDRICAASSRMGALIDHLLELSRMSRAELKLEAINLSELAMQVLDMFQETNPQRCVDLHVADSITILGDISLFRLVLENLLGNAWKYTSKKPLARIEFGMTQVAGQEVFFVRDDGVGFDMAYKQRLFGAFERLHGTEFEGIGIGLATSQRIIKRHGGKIWAEGRVGEGATFYFTLPVYF